MPPPREWNHDRHALILIPFTDGENGTTADSERLLELVIRPVLDDLTYQMYVETGSGPLNYWSAEHIRSDALLIADMSNRSTILTNLLIMRLHAGMPAILLLAPNQSSFFNIPADYMRLEHLIRFDLSDPYSIHLSRRALEAQIRLLMIQKSQEASPNSNQNVQRGHDTTEDSEVASSNRTKAGLSVISYELIEEFDRKLTVEEIEAAAQSVFDFTVEGYYNNAFYNSASAQAIFRWVMALADQPIPDGLKMELADRFRRLLLAKYYESVAAPLSKVAEK